jgi:hypothetical protein
MNGYKIETPQLRGLEVNPQLMRSETKERIKTNAILNHKQQRY